MLIPRSSRRPGTAPLEFVLVWPLLLFLCAGLFLMARAVIAKEAAATAARSEGWAVRPPSAETDAFDLRHRPGDSVVGGGRQVPVRAGTLFPQARFEAESRLSRVDGTWDHHVVSFDPALGDLVPDADVFRLLMLKNRPGQNLPNLQKLTTIRPDLDSEAFWGDILAKLSNVPLGSLKDAQQAAQSVLDAGGGSSDTKLGPVKVPVPTGGGGGGPSLEDIRKARDVISQFPRVLDSLAEITNSVSGR